MNLIEIPSAKVLTQLVSDHKIAVGSFGELCIKKRQPNLDNIAYNIFTVYIYTLPKTIIGPKNDGFQ